MLLLLVSVVCKVVAHAGCEAVVLERAVIGGGDARAADAVRVHRVRGTHIKRRTRLTQTAHGIHVDRTKIRVRTIIRMGIKSVCNKYIIVTGTIITVIIIISVTCMMMLNTANIIIIVTIITITGDITTRHYHRKVDVIVRYHITTISVACTDIYSSGRNFTGVRVCIRSISVGIPGVGVIDRGVAGDGG